MLAKRFIAMCLVLIVAGCVTLPTGYEALRTEANLVEGAKFIENLRDQYVMAYQRGILDREKFILAVKADESLTALWNQLVLAVANKQDDYALWMQVLQAELTLENLLAAWIPGYQPPEKPVVLRK